MEGIKKMSINKNTPKDLPIYTSVSLPLYSFFVWIKLFCKSDSKKLLSSMPCLFHFDFDIFQLVTVTRRLLRLATNRWKLSTLTVDSSMTTLSNLQRNYVPLCQKSCVLCTYVTLGMYRTKLHCMIIICHN